MTNAEQVSFRLVVFKPFVGEVLSGSITNSDSDGIWGTQRAVVENLEDGEVDGRSSQ